MTDITVTAKPEQSWFAQNKASLIRHGVINFFMAATIASLLSTCYAGSPDGRSKCR